VDKSIGKGLQTIGKKIGSILPGLIGSIVSFFFKATGKPISFLPKIINVVTYLIEEYLKCNR